MEKQEIFSGKTVEEAIETGLKTLGIGRESAEIEVLEEGKRKLFGSVPARVRVKEIVREETPVQPAAEEHEDGEKTDGERAVAFLRGLLSILGSEAEPVLGSEGEKIVINLDAESSKGLIGRRGEIIDALQTLAGAVANTGRKEYKRVVVDCENYRETREETLRRVANKLAAKAVRLGKRVRLEPMNPYERRIIHFSLVDNPDVTTKSEGKEPARFVVIIPKNLKNNYDRNRNNRGKFGERREGGRDRRTDRNGSDRRDRPYPKRELPTEETPRTSGTSFRSGSTPGYKKGGFSGFFGTYLGNASEDEPSDTTRPDEPTEE